MYTVDENDWHKKSDFLLRFTGRRKTTKRPATGSGLNFVNYEGTYRDRTSNLRRIAVVSQMCINLGVIVTSVKNALDLWRFNPKTTSFLMDIISSFPIYQVWTLWDYSFLSYKG